MLQSAAVNPARSYEEALERAAAFKARDDERILPEARTVLLEHGARTHLAVVLLHGLTNHPGQYRQFAPMLFERGANVFVPRLPEQGDRNRMTRRLAALTAESLLKSASEAVDIACGLGERVCVMGLSTSGVLAAYFAQYRPEVGRAVCIVPVFSVLHVPHGVSRAVTRAALLLPNLFLWWDNKRRMGHLPLTAYPKFPTRAMAECMRIADDVYDRSLREPIAAKSVVMVTHAHDPAVNNSVTAAVARNWRARGAANVLEYCFADLPAHNHDIVDPAKRTRVEIVYPRLLEFAAGTP